MSTEEWENTLRERGGFEAHEAARRLLAEFGGVESNARGPGMTMARVGFRFDPTVAEWDDEIVMSPDQTRHWSAETDGVLRGAGWRPGRSVPTETWEWILRERGTFVPHEAARRFLSEFDGLITYGWPADTVTRSAVSSIPSKPSGRTRRSRG